MNPYLMEDFSLLDESLKAFANTSIVVTGATGLIGSLILRAISVYNENHGAKIRAIGIARDPIKTAMLFGDYPNLDFVYQDICHPFQVPKADCLIHTACCTNSKAFITNPVEVMDGIYRGTKNAMEWAKQNDVKGVVYLSSMEAFGKVISHNRVKEDELGSIDLHSVRSCYSEGKRVAEHICSAYASEYHVPVRIARLAQTFGAGVLEGENRVFAQFARSALKGDNILLHTTGQSMGNYVYTRDAIKAILLLLRAGENGAAYSIVNENTTITIADMAKTVALHFSNGRSKVAFEIAEENRFGYAPDTHLLMSNEKMTALGWKPEVDLLEMYERMLPDIADQ